MRLPERLRRSLARSDVQTAWIVSGVLLIATCAPGLFLYAYAAMESLEEADRWFDFVLQVAVREVDDHGAAASAGEFDDIEGRVPNVDAALRLRSPNGEIVYERGVWPDPLREIQALNDGVDGGDRNLRSFWFLRHGNWMVGDRVAASGTRVELALPLRHFASESSELRRRALVSGVVAASLMLLVGLGAAMRAFSPLRRATAVLHDVDTGSLGLRLPSRGTGDPIDVHAETLNSVLERIDAAFVRLRSFSSDVAHELRTPLNRISNVTEVALLEGGERQLRAALEAVQGTTEDLARVVQALLLLAEIDDRRLALRPVPIEVGPWLRRHADFYAPSFEEAGVKLAAHSEAAVIEGDRTLLDRVIANLLDNALAHAPAGSSVEIHAAQRGDGIAIAVDDSGPGIPERDRARIFERFARLDGETGSGHGLGLALARAIASLHGGSLRAFASPLGGARFELWVPRSRAVA
jgi:signal transduction histidine kinase